MSDTRSLPELFAEIRSGIRSVVGTFSEAEEWLAALDEIAERQHVLFCGGAMSWCDCSTKGEAYVCRHLRTACKDKR